MSELVEAGMTNEVVHLNKVVALHEGQPPRTFSEALTATAEQLLIDSTVVILVTPLVLSLGSSQRQARPNFTQTTAHPQFSDEGAFAGKTIDQVADALRSGQLRPTDVPVDYLIREGHALAINTRSSLALRRAGIDLSEWTLVNRTGDLFFEAKITERLARNGITNQGTPVIRITGAGSDASSLK